MYIVIAGSGQTAPENARALMKDWLSSLDGTHTIFWAVDHHWNATHEALFDEVFPPEGETPHLVEIITTTAEPTQGAAKFLSEFDDGDFVRVSTPARKAVQLAYEDAGRKAEDVAVVVLYDEAADESDDPAYDALDEASRLGVKALYDITNAMGEVVMGEEETITSDFPSLVDLEGMERTDLQALAEREGLTLSNRSRTPTYVQTLNEHFRSLESAGVAADADEGEQGESLPEASNEERTAPPAPATTSVLNPEQFDLDALKDMVVGVVAPGHADVRSLLEKRFNLMDERLQNISSGLADLATTLASITQDLKALETGQQYISEHLPSNAQETAAPSTTDAAPSGRRAIRRR